MLFRSGVGSAYIGAPKALQDRPSNNSTNPRRLTNTNSSSHPNVENNNVNHDSEVESNESDHKIGRASCRERV